MRFMQCLRASGRGLLTAPTFREAYRAATVTERLPRICVKTPAMNQRACPAPRSQQADTEPRGSPVLLPSLGSLQGRLLFNADRRSTVAGVSDAAREAGCPVPARRPE